MAEDPDDSLPYLPAAAPVVPPADPAVPDAPATVPTTPPTLPTTPPTRPADPGGDDSEAEQRALADRIATRNVPTVRPSIDYGLPIKPAEPVVAPDQFVRPDLESMGPSTTALLVGRGLMVIAMVLIGLAARRASGTSRNERAEAFWPVVGSAGVFVVVALAGMVFWSVTLAVNAQRLKARGPTPRSVGWSWAPPVIWVIVSALTYLRIDMDGDLDPLPGVAGLGFAVLLAIPYARMQGLFRRLSRQPPVLWLSAYPLDLLAFGLVWWRLTSWPDPITASDGDHVRLTANVAFGAAAALAVNALVFVWLAQRGSAAVYERLSRLEARHREDDPVRPDWFASGVQTRRDVAPSDTRPLINITPLTGLVALFHVLWGVSLVLFAVALARLAFEYDDRAPSFDGTLLIDDDDADRIAFVAGVVVLVYVLTIVVHAVWGVLVALNARRVTVHAPNPATFGIVFAPMPVLVVAGLLIGGTIGYWIVVAGLVFAFFALLRANQMLMALSARLGGQLRGFSTWTALIFAAYLIGVVENFLFSRSAGRLGFIATASVMQGILIGIGGVAGFRAMRALDATLSSSRQMRRESTSDGTGS